MDKERLSIIDRNNVEFFSKVFTELLDDWKKKTGETQKSFARNYMHVGSENSITRWKDGSAYPTRDNIERMAKIFGVEPSEFYPMSTIDRYRYSTKYQEKGAEILEAQCIAMDLKPCFLRAVQEIVDFGDIFPAFNIKQIPNLLYDDSYKRLPLLPAAEPSNSIVHFHRDGKCYRLSHSDLAFLKDVQSQVGDYIRFLFTKQEEELARKTELLNELHIEKNGENSSLFSDLDLYYMNLSDLERLHELVQYKKNIDKEEEPEGAVHAEINGEKDLDESIKELRDWIVKSANQRQSFPQIYTLDPPKDLIEGYKLEELKRQTVPMDLPPHYKKGDVIFTAPNGKRVLGRSVENDDDDSSDKGVQ